jgi:hypothetical protein
MPSQTQFDHEEFCAKALVSLCREPVEFTRRGNDKTEPDMIFSGENDSLGIEVTTAFFQGDEDDPNAHARNAFKYTEKSHFKDQKCQIIWQGTDSYLRLEKSLKTQLAKKCGKSYRSPARVWLCIYAEREALVELSELDAITERLEVPAKHPLERIFVFHDLYSGEGKGNCGAIQVFPKLDKFR